MIRNIYIFFITLTLFIFQFLYPQDINEFNYYNYESGNIRHLNCDDYEEDPFLYFVCDSIHNRIIQKNTHECSYYYDSMDETESANVSTMFINYQNNGQINSEEYGLSDLDNKLKKIFINVFQMRNINITNKKQTFIEHLTHG